MHSDRKRDAEESSNASTYADTEQQVTSNMHTDRQGTNLFYHQRFRECTQTEKGSCSFGPRTGGATLSAAAVMLSSH